MPKVKYIPNSFQIGSDNDCGMKCYFCATRYLDGPRTDIGMDQFKEYIDKIYALGCEGVCLAPVYGDPMASPDFVDRVKYCSNLCNFAVDITTNLLSYEEGMLEEMFECPTNNITFLVSCYGNTPELFRKITGVDKFDLFLEKLKLMYKELSKIKQRQTIYFIFRHKLETMPPEKLEKHRGDYEGCVLPDDAFSNPLYRIIKLIQRTHHLVRLISRYSNCDMRPLMDESIPAPMEEGDFLKHQDDLNAARPMNITTKKMWLSFSRPYIWGNGDISMCSSDFMKKLVIGNMSDPLDTVFGEGSLWEQMMEEKKAGMHRSICKSCGYYL